MKSLREQAIELHKESVAKTGASNKTKIAEELFKYAKDNLKEFSTGWSTFRRKVHYWIDTDASLPKTNDDQETTKKATKSGSVDSDKPFVLSAWHDNGYMMNIEEYCRHYKLPHQDVRQYKLVSHTGTPFFNILFKENVVDSSHDCETVKAILEKELTKTYKYTTSSFNLDKESVLKWADLHFGAHIRNLVITKDYDSNILQNGLNKSVDDVNSFGFKKVHVHINGDLIESFSGLNHINSWMSMNPEQIGAKAVMLCTQTLDNSLKRIKNLGKILIVAGNHDRTSKANDEDVKGGAAEMIAWGLTLMGYDVEFHPMITRQLVDGIYHINLHGDKVISKRATKDIIWDYGMKGKFNFVFEAHLHAIIEQLSVASRDKFKVIKDDSIDHRRIHLPSFFTGNYYSETLNFTSNAGYVVIWDNGDGLPQVFYGSI